MKQIKANITNSQYDFLKKLSSECDIPYSYILRLILKSYQNIDFNFIKDFILK